MDECGVDAESGLVGGKTHVLELSSFTIYDDVASIKSGNPSLFHTAMAEQFDPSTHPHRRCTFLFSVNADGTDIIHSQSPHKRAHPRFPASYKASLAGSNGTASSSFPPPI